MSNLIYYLLPSLLILLTAAFHLRTKKKETETFHAVLKDAQESGLTEPPSPHPVVDPSVVMGSGAFDRGCRGKKHGGT